MSHMARFRDRSTSDLIILMLAGMVSAILLMATASVLISSLVSPNDTTQTRLVNFIIAAVNAALAGVIGFVAGKNSMRSSN